MYKYTQSNVTFLTPSSIFLIMLFLHCVCCLCLRATGATMSVVIDLPFSVCVWISAVVVIIYTVLGGLYSVAYTDVIQISLVFLSLVRFYSMNVQDYVFFFYLDPPE